MRLGVDPKHADQMVRGTVVLPARHGQDASASLVIAGGEKVKEAEAAGADHVGRRRAGEEDPGGLARLRRRRRDAGHDARGRQAREGARAARPDAQSEDRHRDVRRRGGGARDQGGQGRVPRGQDRDHPRRRSASSRSTTQKLVDNAHGARSTRCSRAKPSAAKGKYVQSIYLCLDDGPGRRGRSGVGRDPRRREVMIVNRTEKTDASSSMLARRSARRPHVILAGYQRA